MSQIKQNQYFPTSTNSFNLIDVNGWVLSLATLFENQFKNEIGLDKKNPLINQEWSTNAKAWDKIKT